MVKRKTIPPKLMLKVLKRDNHKCQICGKSPATNPELVLEVDHIVPVSKGGGNDIKNLQTLCILCNRGKGNDEDLEFEIRERIDNLLEQINPEILIQLNRGGEATVVANEGDFSELMRLSSLNSVYEIEPTNNTIIGYHAGRSLGIYTLQDNYAGKVNFLIRKPSTLVP